MKEFSKEWVGLLLIYLCFTSLVHWNRAIEAPRTRIPTSPREEVCPGRGEAASPGS